MTNAYSWLLFDADGTLFDFDAAEVQALRRTLDEAADGLTPEEAIQYRETFRRINGNLWRLFENGGISQDNLKVERFARLVEETGLPGDPHEMSKQYLANLAQNSDLLPGSEEILASLSGEYRLALITNGLKAVQRPRFGRSSIIHHFEVTVISEEVGAAKPDPRIFDVTFAQMGQPSRDAVLIIGDSLTSDIAGGINYGIDTCWYNPASLPRPDGLAITYEIYDLHQLTRLLSR